jgi:very-short-patch-repair endonuclease/predicted transcriptional regulator of viral defense system
MSPARNVLPPIPAKCSVRDLHRAISWLAERQHGVVARVQLLAIGLSRHAIAHLLATGRLHRVHRGVFAVGHRKLTQGGRWMAAVLTAGQGAVLSHLSAAALWGMLPVRSGAIDVTTTAKKRGQKGIRVRQAKLAPRDIRTRDGIPVTSPERTLLDLAATHPNLLDRAIREAHYLRLTSLTSLTEICNRNKGRAGSKALAQAIEDADLDKGPTREEFERRFRLFLKKHKLPIPLFNPPIEINGITIHPDCLWPSRSLIVELDSRKAHATPQAFEDDRARDRALQAAGYRVIRITWRQLHRQPQALLMDLQAFLADPAHAGR